MNSYSKILVADDNPESRELIRSALAHSGHVVLEAGDGMEALECARRDIPDLILLDLRMPVLDGISVLRELRCDRRFDDIPIVALTASAMDFERDRILAEGFTAYLSKPIGIRALRQAVTDLLCAQLTG